jgi:hypothetical protein
MGPDPENRVGDQDTGSPSRPVSSALQVSGEPFPSWSGKGIISIPVLPRSLVPFADSQSTCCPRLQHTMHQIPLRWYLLTVTNCMPVQVTSSLEKIMARNIPYKVWLNLNEAHPQILSVLPDCTEARKLCVTILFVSTGLNPALGLGKGSCETLVLEIGAFLIRNSGTLSTLWWHIWRETLCYRTVQN